MYAKKALSVVASLALAEQALGFNAHRHMHEDKRAYKVDIVTHWVTVTVVDGESAPAGTPTPTPTPAAPQPEVPEVQYTPTTTSTSIVVVPTPTPVIAAPSTTLLTSVAPKASSQAPVIEQAAVAVASTPASSANVATASSSSVSTGGKRGIAYNDPTKVNAFFSGACKECSWAYNWDSSDNGLSVSGADFVPCSGAPSTSTPLAGPRTPTPPSPRAPLTF
ncbi:hypothetical protein ColLi_05163 [Colletotrichum liriopes]|uniref:Asl1-like glycosyl hydrolase catalytic domain-containing protein n=1 Tax=Colletotrichum liriopes TaxID=708192 RepID=A0AA37GJY0_9PEZI|nr:hypothetical protein ColLi_05163 [Colletotrichum liriopes]